STRRGLEKKGGEAINLSPLFAVCYGKGLACVSGQRVVIDLGDYVAGAFHRFMADWSHEGLANGLGKDFFQGTVVVLGRDAERDHELFDAPQAVFGQPHGEFVVAGVCVLDKGEFVLVHIVLRFNHVAQELNAWSLLLARLDDGEGLDQPAVVANRKLLRLLNFAKFLAKEMGKISHEIIPRIDFRLMEDSSSALRCLLLLVGQTAYTPSGGLGIRFTRLV